MPLHLFVKHLQSSTRFITDRLQKPFLFSLPAVYFIILLIALAVSIQKVTLNRYTNQKVNLLATTEVWEGKKIYRNYDRQIEGNKDLLDVFAYSPSYAVWYSAMRIFPEKVAAVCWNLISVLVLIIGYRAFAKTLQIQARFEVGALLFSLPALINSLQHFQANVALLGCALGASALWLRHRIFLGLLLLIFAATMKPYILVAGIILLFVLQPREIPKSLVYAVVAFIVCFFLPFFFLDSSYAATLYQDWFSQMRLQNGRILGESVMALVHHGLRVEVSNLYIQMTWLCFLLAKVIYICFFSKLNKQIIETRQFLTAFCLIMVGLIIFNHKTEGPTLIIAILPAALWYQVQFLKTTNDERTFQLKQALVFLLGLAAFYFPFFLIGDLKVIAIDTGIRILPLFIIWIVANFVEIKIAVERNRRWHINM